MFKLISYGIGLSRFFKREHKLREEAKNSETFNYVEGERVAREALRIGRTTLDLGERLLRGYEARDRTHKTNNIRRYQTSLQGHVQLMEEAAGSFSAYNEVAATFEEDYANCHKLSHGMVLSVRGPAQQAMVFLNAYDSVVRAIMESNHPTLGDLYRRGFEDLEGLPKPAKRVGTQYFNKEITADDAVKQLKFLKMSTQEQLRKWARKKLESLSLKQKA